MATKIPPCTVCGKATKAECSHVECPNRHRLTAQVRDEPSPRTVDDYQDTYDVRVNQRGAAHG